VKHAITAYRLFEPAEHSSYCKYLEHLIENYKYYYSGFLGAVEEVLLVGDI